MNISELKALCIKTIETAEAYERKMEKDKLSALPCKETPLGKLQILFSELSERTSDTQLWDLTDESEFS